MKEYGFIYQGQWVQPGVRVEFNGVAVVSAGRVGGNSCYRFETECGLVLHYEHHGEPKWQQGDKATFRARVRNIRRCAKTGRIHADLHHVLSEKHQQRMVAEGWKYATTS